MQKIEKFIHDDMPQEFYDHFNEFIFANESKVFEKLVSKVQLVTYVKDVPGSIVELGVFKGSGLVAWLKVCRALNLRKRVYGFDFFNGSRSLNLTPFTRPFPFSRSMGMILGSNIKDKLKYQIG